ncbi:hypothetical protein PybrP1_011346 [[Pythium] brassicae (nom. inval.)]|nr:hypothetical protein PybrP1_011346 [[Pythium] brassicae (nom. inval.)]
MPYTSEILALCAPRNVDVVAGRPIPTNSWWGNLVTCDAESNVTQPIWPNPYTISVEMTGYIGFTLSYPYRMRFYGNPQPNGVPRYYAHAVLKEVIFTAAEFVTKTPTFRVVSWTDLGVKLQMKVAGTAQTPSTLETDVVSGMAYFTATYQGLTPRVALSNPILAINGLSYPTGSTLSGKRFVVETVNGNRWIVYAIGGATITFRVGTNMLLTATSAFAGVLRVANTFSSTHTSVYDFYRECVVTGGSVSVKSDSAYTFEWATSGSCAMGMVHFALPHQRATMDITTAARIANFALNSTTRGEMSGFVTRTIPPVWRMTESASIPITFYPKTRFTSSESLLGSSFLKTLISDVQATWTISTRGSFYFNGKAAQKYASLCLMANDRAIVGSDVSILRRCVTKLETSILPFLDNTWYYPLRYDRVFGGIVSSQGFVTKDLNADFGNTVYNDHHYHYGYWVYTAAVLNFLHPTWSRIGDLNAMTRLLLRDVANPSRVDPYFPRYRHFDWSRGHSYSHGVTTFADGKDQESTSEDINLSYAVFLYAQVTGNTRVAEVSKLMLKLNARAVQTYFLMENSNTVQPPSLLPNKVPGIFFDNKLDYATWFSAEKYCIHGIQMIPITPVTEFVRTRTFVKEEWDQVLSNEPIVTSLDITNPWLSLLMANYARIDRARAIAVLQTCQVDDGLSRSWALYMAAQLN